jgi:glycine hydroxymethyltransferase
MENYFFNGDLTDIDNAIARLTKLEAERQKRKLIMIPSESFAPQAVRESLGSVFQNVYAEGYPPEEMRSLTENEILDYKARLGDYRRNSDPRYYKGVEYIDILESLARRRCAELFANDRISADEIQVNVQPLSGAPANNAVYHLINPGDTVLAMDLLHGGHLSHGSPVNRSGMLYNIVHYTVNPETQLLDYDEMQRLASEYKPRMVIAGYTSYPYIPDWERYRKICDSVGAILMADIAHIAGLVAAGVVASPVGYADVITFTSHKTLTGPRAAVILTTDPELSKRIDKAVFPGEQGGPHTQVFAALATNFKIAATPEFKVYQQQILNNTQAIIKQLQSRGIKVAYQGSNSHMLLVDCKCIKGEDGTTLSGDMAARILDNAGIVLNRNTIPGDKSALRASGIRMGTSCITQIGLKEEESAQVADIIADLLFAIHPYSMPGAKGLLQRAKIDFDVFESCKTRVRRLCEKHNKFTNSDEFGYPHFYYIDDSFVSEQGTSYLLISGDKSQEFVNFAFQNDAESLSLNECQDAVISVNGELINGCLMLREDGYQFGCPSEKINVVAAWLRDLSDGFIRFDDDLRMKLPGPVFISETIGIKGNESVISEFEKPYAIGKKRKEGIGLPEFDFSVYENQETQPSKLTPLHDIHIALGAKMMPFAGWDMPLWYTSIKEEHQAVRNAAGLFDVSHMGVYQVSGKDACAFLDSVCGNDISALEVGDTCYTHFLDLDANVIDDLIVYAIEPQKYLVVVNASNDDKDWAWLNAVHNDEILIDRESPLSRAFGRNSILENLRSPEAGERMRVDLALQGQASKRILAALDAAPEDRKKIDKLEKGHVTHVNLAGFDLYIARTGYTGEKISYELFVHPAKLPELWNMLLEAGKADGLMPCGLGARDSLRIEAGLPLYGHELAGPMNYRVNEAGFSHFVKTYKPWFIGRNAYLKHVKEQKQEIVRFKFNEKAVRMAHTNDPVLDSKGRVIGRVTSCSVDKDGWIIGMAMIESAYKQEGTSIFIYQNSEKLELKDPSSLQPGDRTVIPSQATIISRYPKL